MKKSVILLATLLALGGPGGMASAEVKKGLTSVHLETGLPLHPGDEAWEQAPILDTDLLGQLVTPPTNTNPSVTSAQVQSLHNEDEIAFLVSWEDATEDRYHGIDQFSDAVALEVPYQRSDLVPFTMGGPGQRVLILHWAAFRQENIEGGYYDTPKAYPNYSYDWYPHAKPPYAYPQDWKSPYALSYIGGEKVLRKNSLKTPVREVVAEGFGTSTWKDIQGAEGKGIYRDGRWQVVIKRRFLEQSTSNPDWGPGKDSFFTLAIWDGGAGERGSRKSLKYGWIPLHMEEP